MGAYALFFITNLLLLRRSGKPAGALNNYLVFLKKTAI
jgi:hypothetical protein